MSLGSDGIGSDGIDSDKIEHRAEAIMVETFLKKLLYPQT